MDEFEFQPDPTTECGVTCPQMSEKSMYYVVNTLERSSAFIFDWNFFIIAGNKDNYKVLDEFDHGMQSAELAALDKLKKTIFYLIENFS